MNIIASAMPIALVEAIAKLVFRKPLGGYLQSVSVDSMAVNFTIVPIVIISVFKQAVGIVAVLHADTIVTS